MEVAGSREGGPKTTVPRCFGGPKTPIKLPYRPVVSVPTETALAVAVMSYDLIITWGYVTFCFYKLLYSARNGIT